jgi:hypothetical protein
MTDPMTLFAQRYAFNTNAVRGLARGMEGADWTTRHADTNPAHWVLGHIAFYRRRIARVVGIDIAEAEWEAKFTKGTQPSDCSDYPPPNELVNDLKEHSEAVATAMIKLPEPKRAEHWATFAGKDHSIESGLSFLYFHETYHVGQLSQLRRLAGHRGLA